MNGTSTRTLAMRRDTEPEELTPPRPRHCAFLGVDAQLQDLLEEGPDPAHHPFARYATAHVNVAVAPVPGPDR